MLIDKAVETAPQTQQTENGQTESAIKPVSETAPITVDFERLQEENKDIIAWLYCPDTEINYPVVQSKDNEYYLRRLLDGTWNIAGTRFMDYRNAADCSDLHTIIYGHNMRVKSMFGSLHDFESEDFYKKHNKIYLYQPGKTIKCTIYSVYDCLDKSATYNTDFSDDGNDNKWVDWLTMTVNNNAYYPIKKKPAEKDHIITLSTCSGKQKGDSYRFVVHSLVTDTVIYEE